MEHEKIVLTEKHTLHQMRETTKINGAAVARLCGVSYRTLRNWEIGENIPNILKINELLKIYGYSFYELDLSPFINENETNIKTPQDRLDYEEVQRKMNESITQRMKDQRELENGSRE